MRGWEGALCLSVFLLAYRTRYADKHKAPASLPLHPLSLQDVTTPHSRSRLFNFLIDGAHDQTAPTLCPAQPRQTGSHAIQRQTDSDYSQYQAGIEQRQQQPEEGCAQRLRAVG